MQSTLTGTAEMVRQIKQILVTDLQVNVVPDEIPDNYSLLEGGLALDSILIAELIAHIEDRFGLQFDERVLEPELFADLSVLAEFVAGEQLAKSNAQALQA